MSINRDCLFAPTTSVDKDDKCLKNLLSFLRFVLLINGLEIYEYELQSIFMISLIRRRIIIVSLC